MVKTCVSCGRKFSRGCGFSFFSFPNNDSLQTEWLKFCGLDLHPGNDNSKIKLCSEHFDESSFRITRTDGPIILKPDAIPSLYPRKKSTNTVFNPDRSSDQQKLNTGVVPNEVKKEEYFPEVIEDPLQLCLPIKRQVEESVPFPLDSTTAKHERLEKDITPPSTSSSESRPTILLRPSISIVETYSSLKRLSSNMVSKSGRPEKIRGIEVLSTCETIAAFNQPGIIEVSLSETLESKSN